MTQMTTSSFFRTKGRTYGKFFMTTETLYVIKRDPIAIIGSKDM